MRKKEIDSPLLDKKYLEYMVTSIRKKMHVVKKPSQVQEKSTLDALSQNEHQRRKELFDLSYWGHLKSKAEIPIDQWKERQINPQEYLLYKKMQRAEKNTLGQSEKSAFSDERREMARQAYMSTPGIKEEDLNPQEREKIIKLEKIKLATEINGTDLSKEKEEEKRYPSFAEKFPTNFLVKMFRRKK